MTTQKLRPVRRSNRLCVSSAWVVCVAVVCAGGSPLALAVTDLSPYATVSIEHDSNVFARPAGEPPFAAAGDNALGDTVAAYIAGVKGDFKWGADHLQLNAQGERFDYNQFSSLNHFESKFGGSFEWYMTPIVDSTISYQQSRIMAPLADTLSTQLEMQTDKTAQGTMRVVLTPRWRFDLQPEWHQLDTPLPGYPGFGLRETSAAGSLNYLGISKLTAGLKFAYTKGAYYDIVAATRYHQWTAELTADYAVTGLSSFSGQLGYTKRDSSLVNPADASLGGGGAGGVVGATRAFTGSLGFRRQLSVKTSFDLRVYRQVDSYVASANSEIGTGGEAGVTWKPDVKFAVALHYRQATESIQGDQATANFTNRTDRLHSESLELKYLATRWLTVRPFLTRYERSSNFAEANYRELLVGVDLTARWQ